MVYFNHASGSPGRAGGGVMFLIPGVMLIGLGVMILIMPELLAAMVATFFIFVGISLLGLGYNLRRMGAAAQRFQTQQSEDASWENL